MLIYQNFILDKTLSTFAQGKRHKLTGQQLKLLITISLLSKDVAVVPKLIYGTLRELNHSANWWWLRTSLSLLVTEGLLLVRPFGKVGKRYFLSISGKLLIHNLDSHFSKEVDTFKAKYQL